MSEGCFTKQEVYHLKKIPTKLNVLMISVVIMIKPSVLCSMMVVYVQVWLESVWPL